MADALSRRTLARAALRLNAQNGFAGRLPALILMTDTARLADPLRAARALPKGSAVILREPDAKKRAVLARGLLAMARSRALIVLIANGHALGADGVHFSEKNVDRAYGAHTRHPGAFVTVAAHSARGLWRAALARADAAILGSVFATLSHESRAPLTNVRARMMAQNAAIPVYALGGIDAKNAGRISPGPFAGLAAIGGLIPDGSFHAVSER